jgi:hypothetical protein
MLVAAGVADASKTASIHDGGGYAPKGVSSPSAIVNLYVSDHGKQLAPGTPTYDKAPALQCPLTTALESEGFGGNAAYILVEVPNGVKIPIHNRSFSYTGPAFVDSDFIASGNPNPGTISISGHFKAGKIVALKTIAITGTVSASLCGTSIPSTLSLVWDPDLQP